MKSKRVEIEHVVTPNEFYDALVTALEKSELQMAPRLVFHWYHIRKALPISKLEIIKNLIPIKTETVTRGQIKKSIKTMETLPTKLVPESYFGLEGLERKGYFGIRNESQTKTILFVESEDEYWRLFDRVFDVGVSELGRQRITVTTDIPPEPGENASREEWFRCYYERRRIGRGHFTLDHVARKIGLSPSKTRYYAALWKHEHIGESPKKKWRKKGAS